MSVPPRLEPGTVIAGRYRVDKCIGSGGMGAVYLVQHVNTDEWLALKVLHETVLADAMAIERFRREARAPARIDSDHVVRVTDADTAPELDGAPFLVMEFLKGSDLEHELEQKGALSPEHVVLYLNQVARALDKAHSLGIVHRDLKPENLFLAQREDGTACIKILDFGIAKITGGAAQALQGAGKTETGTITGTPLYMSPEQIKGQNSLVTGATDVWALGLIAVRLLSGKPYWTAASLPMLVAQIAYEPLVPPSARGLILGPAFDAWFACCCAREPSQRFHTATEAIAALERALHDAPSGSIEVGSTSPLARSLQGASISMAGASAPPAPVPGRPNAKLLLGGAGVIAVVGVILFAMMKWTPVVPSRVGATSGAVMPTMIETETTSPSVAITETTPIVAATQRPFTPVPTIVRSVRRPSSAAPSSATGTPSGVSHPAASNTSVSRPGDNELLNVQHP